MLSICCCGCWWAVALLLLRWLSSLLGWLEVCWSCWRPGPLEGSSAKKGCCWCCAGCGSAKEEGGPGWSAAWAAQLLGLRKEGERLAVLIFGGVGDARSPELGEVAAWRREILALLPCWISRARRVCWAAGEEGGSLDKGRMLLLGSSQLGGCAPGPEKSLGVSTRRSHEAATGEGPGDGGFCHCCCCCWCHIRLMEGGGSSGVA